jgi:MoaA/NifB/PqqE/SkfB family radical SAM enzyme
MGLAKNYYLGRRILASNLNTPANRVPYKLVYAVTYKCNSRCTNCNIWKRESLDELTLEEIDRFFSENPYFLWIDITGGEIFLRDDIVDIVKVISKRCRCLHTLHFPTNGLMTDKVVENTKLIKKLGLNKLIVSVSIDGPPEIHDKIRGIKGGFDRAIETYKQLKGIGGISVYPGMTLSGENAGFIGDTVRSIKQHDPGFSFSDLHVNIVHSSPHFYGNQKTNAYPHHEISEAVNGFMRLKKFGIDPVSLIERAYMKKVREYLESERCPMPCHSLTVSAFLDPAGNVFPCTMYGKKIGNIRDSKFLDIWNDTKTRRIAKEINMLKCPQCWTPCEAYQSILANMLRK